LTQEVDDSVRSRVQQRVRAHQRGPGWDDRTTATWPSSTATLIAGEHEAILIDALMTAEQGRQLVSWIAGAGKNLKHIVITHGHGDHFFGAGRVLQAYRAARGAQRRGHR
jgi:glyoxylase-like metal-dependent hydrolase (beta-lactamase superfamily II)